MSAYQTNEFSSFNDVQFMNLLQHTIEGYLKFKKACNIAKQILKDNCHDFFISVDSAEKDINFNFIVRAANQRNVSIDLSIYDSECSLEEVSYILGTMCGLELSWLDEHRYIFDADDGISFLEEEEKTVSFYNNLISNLSIEQICEAEDSLDSEYILYL